jgi:hypothetical protein
MSDSFSVGADTMYVNKRWPPMTVMTANGWLTLQQRIHLSSGPLELIYRGDSFGQLGFEALDPTVERLLTDLPVMLTAARTTRPRKLNPSAASNTAADSPAG